MPDRNVFFKTNDLWRLFYPLNLSKANILRGALQMHLLLLLYCYEFIIIVIGTVLCRTVPRGVLRRVIC